MKNSLNIIFEVLKDYPTYIVGSYVRNLVSLKYNLSQSHISRDVDIATSALPETVIKLFSNEGYSVISTGINYGTVTVIINNIPYEITTFRKDLSTDGRHTTIGYTNCIIEDLSRRDFTINAIAYDIKTDKFLDPFDGIIDLKNKIINTVGNPKDRFEEDYLRLFRAFRFSSTLKFDIDRQTLTAINYMGRTDDWIKHISMERIKMEIDKCFKIADNPSIMFNGLLYSGILRKIMPELVNCYDCEQNNYHLYDVFDHTLKVVDGIDKKFPEIRWAALFHDLGKPVTKEGDCGNYTFRGHEEQSEILASNIMDRFKFSNRDREFILHLVGNHMMKIPDDSSKDMAIRRFINKVGIDNIESLLILKEADIMGKGTEKEIVSLKERFITLKKRFEEILERESFFSIKDLALTGNDIQILKNIPPSKLVGDILKYLLAIVLEDPSKNTREELSELVRNYITREYIP